ncbi:MAG: hypothetical protein ABW080_20395, partial [Candidatus Thiodiazotropha sp.]
EKINHFWIIGIAPCLRRLFLRRCCERGAPAASVLPVRDPPYTTFAFISGLTLSRGAGDTPTIHFEQLET